MVANITNRELQAPVWTSGQPATVDMSENKLKRWGLLTQRLSFSEAVEVASAFRSVLGTSTRLNELDVYDVADALVSAAAEIYAGDK